jgi:hypothetical protein
LATAIDPGVKVSKIRTAAASNYPWDLIRASFDAAAGTEPEAELPAGLTGPSTEDISGLKLADFGEQREQLGIRHQESDFLGISADDDRSGFPSWRTPVVEQVEFTEMDHYAEERAVAGIRDASDIFGAEPAQPRVNASPWSVV